LKKVGDLSNSSKTCLKIHAIDFRLAPKLSDGPPKNPLFYPYYLSIRVGQFKKIPAMSSLFR